MSCCCSVTESCPTLEIPQTAAHQASLSFTDSWSLLKLTSIGSVILSNHLILLPPSPLALNLSQHLSFHFFLNIINLKTSNENQTISVIKLQKVIFHNKAKYVSVTHIIICPISCLLELKKNLLPLCMILIKVFIKKWKFFIFLNCKGEPKGISFCCLPACKHKLL